MPEKIYSIGLIKAWLLRLKIEMVWLIVALNLLATAWLLVRSKRARETRLVRSVVVRAPIKVVFDLVAHVDRMPEWYRTPLGLPRMLGISTLARWGEQIARIQRSDGVGQRKSDDIQIRWSQNKEFGYRHNRRRGMRYESIFRFAPKEDDCLLTWEVRYQMFRWLDVIADRSVIAKDTYQSMGQSLETIRRLAENVSAPPSWKKAVEERNQPVQRRISRAG